MKLSECLDLSPLFDQPTFVAEDFSPLAVSPSNSTDGAGFITRDEKPTIRQSGRTAIIPKGTTVYVTRPGTIYRAQDIGAPGNIKYVMIGLKSPLVRHAIGFFPLTAIGDPKNSQTRAVKGDSTQKAIMSKMEEVFGEKYKYISSADRSSKEPDLVCTIGGRRVQFEIKGRDNSASPITLFNSSLRRGATPRIEMNELAGAFTNDTYYDFEEMINGYRERELHLGFHKKRPALPVVGFPGDPHTPKSGKIPPQFRVSDNPALFGRARNFISNNFKRSGDHYLVIDNRSGQGPVNIYWTGYGKNVLNAPKLPNITSAVLDTYGEPYKGAMRVALKVQLDPSALGMQL